ncbi:MAG: polysaccharide biosynthesis tyrosine autokinase [Armatimonadota bacterium]|nr:polysaccharide biosynthesis tyrosine autokinase [Armatimonadota bacterium]
MEIWRYYRILRKRKWLIVTTTLVCILVVGISILLTKTRWEAYTTVMEKRPEQAEVAIYQPPYIYNYEVQIRLANLAYIAGSQTVLDRTAQTLYELGITSTPEEILRTVVVEPVKNTEILLIKVNSPSQAEAKATADTLAAEFRRFYNDLQRGETTKSRQFIEQRLPIARQEMLEAQAAVRDFKEKNKVVSLNEQSSLLMQRLESIQNQAASARIKADEAKSQMEILRQQLANEPSMRKASEVTMENPIWQELQSSRIKLEIDIQRMREIGGKTDAHPEMKPLLAQLKKIDEQIEDLKRKEQERIISSLSTASNPVYDSILTNLLEAQATYVAAQSQYIAAKQIIDELTPELETLPEKEMKLAQLTLDQKNAEQTYSLLRSKLDEARIKEREAANTSSIQQIDPAIVRKLEMRRGLKLMLALIFGPLLGSGLAFLLHYLDNTIKTPEEAEALLGVPVFAVVPLSDQKALMSDSQLPVIEASYQILSTNLWFASEEAKTSVILIASAEPGVGRSTTVANLGRTLARNGARTIIVDSDLRRPSQHIIFGVQNEKGLSNVLAGQLGIADAVVPVGQDGLLLIPSGPIPTNPVRLFRSPEMKKFVEDISKLADFVLFDSPSGVAFADTTLLAAIIKNVIIVHSAGRVPRGAEAEFRSRLEQIGANTIGAVLNRVKPEDSHGYYHYRRSYEDFIVKDGKVKEPVESKVLGAIPEPTKEQGESEVDQKQD